MDSKYQRIVIEAFEKEIKMARAKIEGPDAARYWYFAGWSDCLKDMVKEMKGDIPKSAFGNKEKG